MLQGILQLTTVHGCRQLLMKVPVPSREVNMFNMNFTSLSWPGSTLPARLLYDCGTPLPWATNNKTFCMSHVVWGCFQAMSGDESLSSPWPVTESCKCSRKFWLFKKPSAHLFQSTLKWSLHPCGCLWMFPNRFLILQDKGILLFEVNLDLSNCAIKWTLYSVTS